MSLSACLPHIGTVGSMRPCSPVRLRAFSLMEIALTFVLLAVALALTAPQLLSGDSAASSRQAQASLEAAAAAGRSLATANGAPSDSLALLEELAPRLTFLDATVDSATAEEVSVEVLDFSMLFAASDTDGVCWGLIETLSGRTSLRCTWRSSRRHVQRRCCSPSSEISHLMVAAALGLIRGCSEQSALQCVAVYRIVRFVSHTAYRTLHIAHFISHTSCRTLRVVRSM